MTRDDLAALMTRVAAKDREAFAALYRATSGKLYGLLLRILSSRALADEALQEVYVKIWDRAGDFDASRASPITWMATIARNRALDEKRRAASARLDELPEGADFVAETEDPLASRERGEQLAALMKCLARLDPGRRQMVLLAYYRGLSRDELSRRLGAPLSTVKTWLRRGLAELKLCLSA